MNCSPHRLLRVVSFLTVVASAAACPAEDANRLSLAEQRGGWKLLFDGVSTVGWRNYGKPTLGDGWEVRDAALVRKSRGAGDLISKAQFKFFELSLEYRISRAGNSGVMFHVQESSRPPWHSGPEVQIQDNVAGRDPQKSGWLYQLYQPVKPDWATRFENQVGFKGIDVDDATRPAGEWNQLYLRVSPLQSEVAVNGVSYFYFHKGDAEWDARVSRSKFARFPEFGKSDQGHLVLQDHGDEVSFRNIKIRELDDNGSVPEPVDGYLSLRGVEAFPELTWAGWEGINDRGIAKAQRPIVLTHAGDGSNRVFVASQIGMIHVFENRPDSTDATMFLDLRAKTHDWEDDDEEGLLGLAFHPQYRENGFLYVYYSPRDEPRVCRVSRFQVSSQDPNRADPDSEQVVMRIEQPFANHNGGSIAFGHDGFLYIALGDGGGRNDPLEHGQDVTSWMGSILRIDVDRSEDGKNYAIPTDNPFRGHATARPEIFAYGFRNIWRMSVDRQTGAIWAGDVGQDLLEEVDIVTAGGNYGWSRREGTHAFGNGSKEGPGAWIEPVWEYDHQIGKSITGGFVYRGTRLPELSGSYLYADYISGKIWALEYEPVSRRVIRNMGIHANGLPVFSFGEDEQGEVYYMIASPSGRTIYKFERTDSQ